MALPVLVKTLLDMKLTKYCDLKVSPEYKHALRITYSIHGNNITIYEERPFYLDKTKWIQNPVARLKYDSDKRTYTLYCADRNIKWHKYHNARPAKRIETLLREIDADPTGIFWG